MAEQEALNREKCMTAALKVSAIKDLVEEHEVLEVYRDVLATLGLSAAVFSSFSKDAQYHEEYRFLLGCSALFCREYQRHNWLVNDPILRYALNNSEPCRKSQIRITTPGQRSLLDMAAMHGFASVGVFPAPSGAGVSRMGVLYVGSVDSQYLESSVFDMLRMPCRMLAAELNEWIIASNRRLFIAENKLNEEEMLLISLERQGLKSKEIARELNMTPASIDSKFQRLISRLGVRNRGEAGKLAYKHGIA